MVATSGALPEPVIDWVLETSAGDIPESAMAFGRRCLLDLLGVAAAGRTTELSRIVHRHARSHFGAGERSAPLFFDGRPVSPAGSALALGMTIDAIDAHDGHNLTKGHTGCHQLPALLAVSAAEGLDDPVELVAALVVGYEFATRAGMALHASAADYHTSGAWGAVGGAALTARLLGLGRRQTFEAMGIGEYHGPRSQMMRVIDHPTMLKDGSGWGAMAGVSAGYLAADGFTGAPAITVNAPEVAHIWHDLGEHWIIRDQYFKPHPVCRWAQPAVEAALELRRTHQLEPADIARVEVTTFHEAARLAVQHPATTEQAQYSLPFPVAAVLARGRLGAAEIGADGLADPAIRDLSARVTTAQDPAHDAAFPEHRYARVAVELADGRRYETGDHEPRGDATDHLDDAEIRAKFHDLAAPVIGAGRAEAIESAVDGLADGGSLQPLLEGVVAPISPRA